MIVECRNISKSFGGIHALKNASLTLKDGEIRALLGGNGSGKSTLIKVASGLIRADAGEIFIDGKPAKITSPKASKRLGIVSTAQELSILPNLTVGENITLCSIPRRRTGLVDRAAIRARSLAVLKKLGIADVIDTPVGSLPVNKQYLIEFAKAMYQSFDILLIDEITSALYREDVAVVRSILNEYRAQGKIILLISHRLQEIYDMCDSVTVMRNGEIIETCDLQTADEQYLLSLMIGEDYRGVRVSDRSEHTGELSQEAFITVSGLPIPKYGTAVDLTVRKGEIIGVAGLQGHGQSDIVRALHGMNGPVRITMNGSPVTIKNPIQAVKHGIAFVSGDRENEGAFKRHDLAANISAVCDIVLRRRLNSVEEALRSVNTKYDSEQQNITSLSGGNQQKVLFGRWMQTQPQLLLADDPSKGIDMQARGEMRSLLYSMADQGTAMIIVSSDEEELALLCADRGNAKVIVMYEGQIVRTLRGAEVTRQNITAATLANGGKNG